MARTDRRRRRSCHRRLLWVGYGLLLTVIVLLSLATTGALQVYHLRQGNADLYTRIRDLNAKHQSAQELLDAQARENKHQDELLTAQQKQARERGAAIAALHKLREKDALALTRLHNELAVRYVDDAAVKQRLQQLEASNAAARTVINNAPPAATTPATKPADKSKP